MNGTVKDCERRVTAFGGKQGRSSLLTYDRLKPAELLIEIEVRFAEAGLVLACLPGNRKPSDDLLDLIEQALLDQEEPVMAKPTPAQIDRMDETLAWIRHLPPLPDKYRNLVHKRLMRSARTGRYRYSWSKLGDELGVSNHTAKAWHGKALAMIATKIA